LYGRLSVGEAWLIYTHKCKTQDNETRHRQMTQNTSSRNKKLSYRLETGRQLCIFVARLLAIAVIFETYVRHVRNLRPINRLIYYTHSEYN